MAVLQARTTSSRLPAKVMLPINGIPLAVLAARRAANTGREVVVATSDDSSDDGLAALLAAHGLVCHRGSLQNTLSRVVDALSGYSDQTIVFRLTADNVFPDGRLLDEVEEAFLTSGLSYMCCNGVPSGLPYGMSAEVTYLGLLREANNNSHDPYDHEHVTPYVIRKCGSVAFDKYRSIGKGHLRCTVDCLDDYLVVQEVFAGVDDPVSVSSFELLERLSSGRYQPVTDKAATKLVLGTAQLGISYGITNVAGKPALELSREIVKMAIVNGVSYLDTARAYGDSEIVIGRSLQGGWQGRTKVITKLSPLANCPEDAGPGIVSAFVDASVYESCVNLNSPRLDVLMLHRSSHLHDWDGAVWSSLQGHRSRGRIGELGVSVQSPVELISALACEDVAYIQMPLNILDWRWASCIPRILEAKASRKLVLHVRSAFLQGVLLSTDPCVWATANVEDAPSVMKWLKDMVQYCGRRSVLDLCVGYLSSQRWVDGVVVGVETVEQMSANINIFCEQGLTDAQLEEVEAGRPMLTEKSLNPALWRK
ncbi:aldo/keto reductase [Pseudomonas sp. Gutcm_11s]|uniref:aldo/keto reductase n=1 Tax=Pseudomonas sp. Gutcm_11s TaxID=3026088 RepID=UPI002362CB56|nr:aldo/keto reductase [Pseudomonas sp. Gutcm_11s]MDD0842209.1 aldo/keto reductase [Pseudomonas sp. Gutcm_11s]